jgi:hypothetical protein
VSLGFGGCRSCADDQFPSSLEFPGTVFGTGRTRIISVGGGQWTSRFLALVENEPCRVSEPRLYASLHGLESLELKVHPRPRTRPPLKCPTFEITAGARASAMGVALICAAARDARTWDLLGTSSGCLELPSVSLRHRGRSRGRPGTLSEII